MEVCGLVSERTTGGGRGREDKKPKVFPPKGRSLTGPPSTEAFLSVWDQGRVVLPGRRRMAVTTSSDATCRGV